MTERNPLTYVEIQEAWQLQARRKELGGSWMILREVGNSRLRRRELVGPRLRRLIQLQVPGGQTRLNDPNF